MTRNLDPKDLDHVAGGSDLVGIDLNDDGRRDRLAVDPDPSPGDPKEGVDTDAEGGDTVGLDQA